MTLSQEKKKSMVLNPQMIDVLELADKMSKQVLQLCSKT